jgi:HEAT repeat protein
LISALKEAMSRDAHDYVCRKLSMIGTAASVPALAALLSNTDRSHMARYALQRIHVPEAGDALRTALSQLNGNLKIGVISSLGARGGAKSVAPLAALLNDGDATIARAAALALGAIGTAESAAALKSVHQASSNRQDVIDALLSCAEALLAHGKKADSNSIYISLSGDQHSRLVRLAATRGMLACAGKQA